MSSDLQNYQLDPSPRDRNKVAQLIKFVAWLFFLIGTTLPFLSGAFLEMIPYSIGFVLLGLIFLGIAEIIDKLHQINNILSGK